MTRPQRGEVWQTRFWPSVGQEITKDRPAVVINEAEFGILPLSIVVPITEWKQRYEYYSWFVPLAPSLTNGLSKMSGADTFQAKSLANERLLTRLGQLTESEVEHIAATLAAGIGV
jgi:mRNA interferase MazF